MNFALDLEATDLAPVFAQYGRLHLPGVLSEGDANAVHAAMGVTPWVKSMHVAGQSYDVALSDLENLTQDARADLNAAFLTGGVSEFQFRYDACRISDIYDVGLEMQGELAALGAAYKMLNSASFLDFVRQLTRDPRPAFADAQATRFRAGDFLTAHDDAVAGKNRLYAYVLNLTPAWRTDWGGLLAFHDQDGHVAEAYAPVFNALNIFRVPQKHSVTEVASYATGDRLSITGWIRER